MADPNGPYTGTVGTAVAFDGSGSSDPDGTIVSYDWDFGDGNTGTGVSPSHTYTGAATYTVSLTVTDDAGASDTATSVAVIDDQPVLPPAGGISILRSLWLVAVWIERRRQRRALADLDDRLLKDIGVSRWDAEREIARPFWR